MRYLLLTSLLVITSVVALSGQHLGLRIGGNSTDANIDFSGTEIETDGESNVILGIFLNLPVGSQLISIQPEINYLNRGYSTSGTIGNIASFEQTVAYVDLGALIRLNFGAEEGLGFYVGAGPYYSYALNGTITDVLGERDIDFEGDRLNRGELQVAGAGGITFGGNFKLFAEVRFMGTLSDQSDFDELEIRQNSLGLNAGIMVPLGN